MENKDLNTNPDYNYDYNIVLSFHLLKKNRDLDPYKIEETIIKGKNVSNTKHPRVCKKFYFGKENETYFVIFTTGKEEIKVITAWSKKGR